MDRTAETLKSMQEQGAHNAAVTEEEMNAARAEGAQTLIGKLERGESVMLMDEASESRVQNAYATGWNAEYMKAVKAAGND